MRNILENFPPSTKLQHIMPDFPHNLVSIGMLYNANIEVLFTPNSLYAYDNNTKIIKLQGWHNKTAKLLEFPIITINLNKL